jgi:hypothetical protein
MNISNNSKVFIRSRKVCSECEFAPNIYEIKPDLVSNNTLSDPSRIRRCIHAGRQMIAVVLMQDRLATPDDVRESQNGTYPGKPATFALDDERDGDGNPASLQFTLALETKGMNTAEIRQFTGFGLLLSPGFKYTN